MSNRVELEYRDSDDRGAVARIIIANRDRLNVLDSDLITQLISTVDNFAGDHRLRALVITGAGEKSFIGGADINEMSRLGSGGESSSPKEFITILHQACSALRRFPVPVIARINGYCLGAGLEVAASCDLRVAAAHSIFGMPEVKVGIPSVIEAALLPGLIGWGRTAELVFTGESISAADALAWGLVERVVPADQLDHEVERLTESILNAGPRAIRLQKELMREWGRLPIEEAIERGVESFEAAYETDEPLKFMQRFLTRKQ
jgi:enoyl-CoA hydratase